MPRPHATSDATKDSLLGSRAAIWAGLVFGAVTLVFLMMLVINVDQIQCSKSGLIALVFGLGTALSTSFIGGYASAKGPVSIPYLGSKPISVAFGGGILALLAASAMSWYIVSKSCVEVAGECSPTTISSTRISCGEVFGLIAPPTGEGFLAVRIGPTTSCAKVRLDDLHNGDQVIVRMTQNKWLYVRRFSAEPAVEGWSYGDYVRDIKCPDNAPHK